MIGCHSVDNLVCWNWSSKIHWMSSNQPIHMQMLRKQIKLLFVIPNVRSNVIIARFTDDLSRGNKESFWVFWSLIFFWILKSFVSVINNSWKCFCNQTLQMPFTQGVAQMRSGISKPWELSVFLTVVKCSWI